MTGTKKSNSKADQRFKAGPLKDVQLTRLRQLQQKRGKTPAETKEMKFLEKLVKKNKSTWNKALFNKQSHMTKNLDKKQLKDMRINKADAAARGSQKLNMNLLLLDVFLNLMLQGSQLDPSSGSPA